MTPARPPASQRAITKRRLGRRHAEREKEREGAAEGARAREREREFAWVWCVADREQRRASEAMPRGGGGGQQRRQQPLSSVQNKTLTDYLRLLRLATTASRDGHTRTQTQTHVLCAAVLPGLPGLPLPLPLLP